jgi:hypothetical protein
MSTSGAEVAVAIMVEVAAGVKGLSTNNFWNPAIEPLNHTELLLLRSNVQTL